MDVYAEIREASGRWLSAQPASAPKVQQTTACDTLLSHVMRATATIRDLRNHFPKVKKLVEAEGEVLVTDRGRPKYKLVLHTAGRAEKSPPVKDYLARLTRHQPRPLRASAAKALHEENRGAR